MQIHVVRSCTVTEMCLIVGALTRGDPDSVGGTEAADAYGTFFSEGQTTTQTIWQKLAVTDKPRAHPGF